MPVLDAKNLTKSLGSRTLFAGADLTIVRGEKVGVVGDNGAGKSTLAKMLAGVIDHDGGTITRRRGTRAEYLEQDPKFPADIQAEDAVLEGLPAWLAARARFLELGEKMAEPGANLEALSEAQHEAGEEIERLGGWGKPDEARRMLKSLGILDPGQKLGTMSGGERRRVALSRLLIAAPDLAILDEPTNHLDADTIEWLEGYLRDQFEGAILMITHDRWLLSSVVTRTLEIESGKLHSYQGGWEAFLEGRAARVQEEERAEKNRQNFLRTEIEWLRRQPKARTTKSKSRIDRAQAALDQAPKRKAADLELNAKETRLGSTILEARNLSVEIAGRTLVSDLTFYLEKGQRVGIVGPSGAGKTTLLRTLLGELESAKGEIVRGKNTKIAYLDQMRSGLDPDLSVYDAVTGGNPTVQVGETTYGSHSYLEKFRFLGEAKRQKVAGLSGGERARLALACLLLTPANVFVLDEPTNDLDIMTLSALEELLLALQGAALIVSHDRYFLDRVATSVLSFIGEQKVERIEGGYSEYASKVQSLKENLLASSAAAAGKGAATGGESGSASGGASGGATSSKSGAGGGANGATSSKSGAGGGAATGATGAASTKSGAPKKRAKLTYGEELELRKLPDELDAQGERVSQLEERLSDPMIFVERREEAAALQVELAEQKAKLDALEERWLELEEKREG